MTEVRVLFNSLLHNKGGLESIRCLTGPNRLIGDQAVWGQVGAETQSRRQIETLAAWEAMLYNERTMSFEEMQKFRKKFELSQVDAARILGIANRKLVSQWEIGFRQPTLIVRRFIRLLNDLPRAKTETILKKLESYGDDDV